MKDNIVKISILTTQSNLEIQCNPYESSGGFFLFCKNGKVNTQIHMELQGSLNSQNNIEKNEQIWRIHIFSFQTYYDVTVIKKEVWYWQKDKT